MPLYKTIVKGARFEIQVLLYESSVSTEKYFESEINLRSHMRSVNAAAVVVFVGMS